MQTCFFLNASRTYSCAPTPVGENTCAPTPVGEIQHVVEVADEKKVEALKEVLGDARTMDLAQV